MNDEQQIDVGTTPEASGIKEDPVVIEADEILASHVFNGKIEATAQQREAS